MKKRTAYQILKIRLYKFRKRLWRIIKSFLLFIMKLAGWLILFAIICYVASYDSNSDNAIPFWLVGGLYFALILNYFSLKRSYENWKYYAKDDEFYKCFCQEYSPRIFEDLLCFCLALKYFDTSMFICFIFALCLKDIWDRRYITNNIKHDLILAKLKNLK